MKAKKFELFMCCLGNGTTVCNKAVREDGDYKTIAHVSDAGNIKFYVPEDYIPETDMQKILRLAEYERKEFRAQFEKMDKYKQYERILDALPAKKFIEVTSDKRPFDERLPELREHYYSIA